MNVYVESNYVLELAFQQEQYDECEQILRLAETGCVKLILPAYCFAESHEKLTRQREKRSSLQRELDTEIKQLKKTSAYATRMMSLQEISSLLIQSYEEEKVRFIRYRDRLIEACQLVPLTRQTLVSASVYEPKYDLKPQDAIVFASVMEHLAGEHRQASCFLNKNTKDFDNPDIVDALHQHNCRMIPRFSDGLKYIQSNLP